MKPGARFFTAALIGFWALLPPVLHAQTSVGRIASLQGEVRLDAFGKGAFIAAVLGDRLYRESVIRVGVDGRATLEIGQATQVAAPGSLLRVSDLLVATERKSGLKWTEALGKLVADARRALQGKPEVVALGSRAADEGSAGGAVEWAVEDEDDSELYKTAMAAVSRGDPAAALKNLMAITSASATGYSASELELWRGYCYFELGGYADAETHLDTARRLAERDTAGLSPDATRLVLLELGAARFYLSRAADAIVPLRALVSARPADDRTLYGYLLLVESLASTGDRTGGAVELKAAEAIFTTGAAAADLAALRRKLSL